jgi:DNA-binding transcriptional LysR family regulator
MNKLESMQTFVRVAEAGSFTAVAQQLHVDRSAVTRQIAALEQHLRVKLITRSTRSLTLTSAGSAYLEQCRTILEQVDAAESGLTQAVASPQGRLRVGLPHAYGEQHLMPVLLKFMQEHPAIELLTHFSDEHANLVEEGLDMSIRITARLAPTDIVRRLGSCRLMTVASSGYLDRHGKPTSPEQLRDHDCLVYGFETQASRWQFQGVDHKPLHVAVNGRLVSNNGEALMQAAAIGMGITQQPDFIAAPYVARNAVVPVLKRFQPPALGIYAVLPSNRYIPHRVNALIDYLATHLA